MVSTSTGGEMRAHGRPDPQAESFGPANRGTGEARSAEARLLAVMAGGRVRDAHDLKPGATHIQAARQRLVLVRFIFDIMRTLHAAYAPATEPFGNRL